MEIQSDSTYNMHHRSRRFRYRHSVAAAALEAGIPTGWVWYWLWNGQLRKRRWLRRLWVRLEDVQRLFCDHDAVQDAFYATGEPLASPEGVRQALSRWPFLRQEMWKAPGEAEKPWAIRRAA